MPEATEIFKALSDRTRLRLLKLLISGQEHCVCELVDALQLPQYTVSRHLSFLRRLGLLHVRREGTMAFYCLPQPQERLIEKTLALLDHLDGEEFQTDRHRLEERIAMRVDGKCVAGSA